MEQKRFSSISEQVYQQLYWDVMRGRFSPGQRVTIRDLADVYQVSTMPIREALHKLTSEGLFKYERRGWKVHALSSQEVNQIYGIRMELESLALKWASEKATDHDIENLKQLANEMDKCLDDDARWVEINYNFHMSLYKLSGSERLCGMIKNLWAQIEPYIRVYTMNVGPLEKSQEQHHHMLDALKARDLNLLDHLIRSHIQITADMMRKALEENPLQV